MTFALPIVLMCFHRSFAFAVIFTQHDLDSDVRSSPTPPLSSSPLIGKQLNAIAHLAKRTLEKDLPTRVRFRCSQASRITASRFVHLGIGLLLSLSSASWITTNTSNPNEDPPYLKIHLVKMASVRFTADVPSRVKMASRAEMDESESALEVHSSHHFHQWYTEVDARKKVEWEERCRSGSP